MRYTGPRLRIMRALGTQLPGLGRFTLERRPNPPGQHGGQRRGKKTQFGTQLLEKQKVRYNYGVTEKALRRVMERALRLRGNPGENLLTLLESRLDNAIFRAGFAPSVIAARQLVSHGHVKVNGQKVTISSYSVDPGEVLSLGAKAQKIPFVLESITQPPLTIPGWIDSDTKNFSAKISTRPTLDSVPFPVEISTVVEYYSRRVK